MEGAADRAGPGARREGSHVRGRAAAADDEELAGVGAAGFRSVPKSSCSRVFERDGAFTAAIRRRPAGGTEGKRVNSRLSRILSGSVRQHYTIYYIETIQTEDSPQFILSFVKSCKK